MMGFITLLAHIMLVFMFPAWPIGFQTDTAAQDTRDWIHRPGTVHVCEGSSARFLWNYNHSTGGLDSVHFSKSSPGWRPLLNIDKHGKCTQPMKRATFIENSTYGFILNNSSMSDSGTYRIDLYHGLPLRLVADSAQLRVLNSSACPDRLKYFYPALYSALGRSSAEPITSNSIKLDKPEDVTLLVVVPAADPPVHCTIATSQKQFNCSGIAGKESWCKGGPSTFSETEKQAINVTLNFVAIEPSNTRIYVHVEGFYERERTTRMTSGSTQETLLLSSTLYALEDSTSFAVIITATLVVVTALIILSIGLNLFFKFRRRSVDKKGTLREHPKFALKPYGGPDIGISIQHGYHPPKCDELPIETRTFVNEQSESNALLPKDLSKFDKAEAILESTIREGQQSKLGLHEAVIVGDMERIRLLCANGEKVNQPGVLGLTCLQLAADYGQCQIIQQLIKSGADVNLTDQDFLPPLHRATGKGKLNVVKLLCSVASIKIDLHGQGNKTALHLACSNQNIEIVEYLVKQGANLNAVDIEGRTPLFGRYDIAEHLALHIPYAQSLIYRDVEAFIAAVDSGNIKVIEYLFKKPFDVKENNPALGTALERARYLGKSDIVALIEKRMNTMP